MLEKKHAKTKRETLRVPTAFLKKGGPRWPSLVCFP